jgi:acyl-CoA dehydrogenase
MSVPYSIQKMDVGKVQKASEKIPIIARPFVSDRAKEVLDIVRTLITLHNA